MKSPWIAWSFADLFASRRYGRMTAVQQALYLAMLGEQATSGPLPTDLDELAWLATRHTRDLDEGDFHEAWTSPLIDCFVERDGKLINERMQMEVEAAETRSANARKAIEARWKAHKEASDTPVSRPKNAGNTIQDRTGHTDRTDTTPHSPPSGGGTRKRSKPEAQVPLVDAALEELGIEEPWVREIAVVWAELREDPKAKARRVSARTWKANVKKLHGYGEAVARQLVEEMENGDWMAPVWDHAEKFAKGRSQAPSGGSWYRGPAISKTERRSRESEIRRRMAAEAGNYLLGNDEALEMARAKGDRKMHELDWMMGRRNDGPKDAPPVLDVTPREVDPMQEAF